jgi:hypothetical protein
MQRAILVLVRVAVKAILKATYLLKKSVSEETTKTEKWAEFLAAEEVLLEAMRTHKQLGTGK